MTINFVSNGDPERIPAIDTRVELKPHVLFHVDSYGDSTEIPHPDPLAAARGEKAYQLQLHGHLVIPAGSPIELLNELLGGKLL